MHWLFYKASFSTIPNNFVPKQAILWPQHGTTDFSRADQCVPGQYLYGSKTNFTLCHQRDKDFPETRKYAFNTEGRIKIHRARGF